MNLSRTWTRHLYGASGIALLVPGTVVAALIVLALTGGFGHLGTFRQVVAGPSLASRGPSGGGVSATSSRLAAAIAATTERPGSGLTGTGAGVSVAAVRGSRQPVGGHAATHPRRGPATPGVGRRGGAHALGMAPTTHRGGMVAPTHPQTSPTTPTHPATPPTTPTPPETLANAADGAVKQVAGGVSTTSDTVAAVVGKVGPPIGPVAASAVTSVGGTVSKILDGAASASANASSADAGSVAAALHHL